jgi:pSer/pThr/pTyr-binding forkhead associated (FHA) protein
MYTDDQDRSDEVVFIDEPQPVEEENASAEADVKQEDTAEDAPQQATLTVRRNGTDTDTVFVVNPPTVIGRFDPAVGPIDIDLGSLPEGAYVSRKHAKIVLEDGVYTIQDLGSSNGTFVLRDDFERVESAELSDGTEIALGNARFVFRIG